jgi:hypothetical protein
MLVPIAPELERLYLPNPQSILAAARRALA